MTIFRLAWMLPLVLSACAVTVNVPVNRFDSPEAIGKRWRVKIDGAVGGSDNVVLTPDASLFPPNTGSPGYERGTVFTAGAGIGLLDNMDAEVHNFDELRFKYQFIGKPRLTAGAGNFSVAATLGTGFDTDNGTGDGLTGTSYQFNLKDYFADAAVIAGYRFHPLIMLYAGPFYRYYSYSATYATGTSSSTLGPPTDYSGSVNAYGASMGIEVGNPLVQGRFEYAYGQVKSGALNTGQSFLGAQVAINFGNH